MEFLIPKTTDSQEFVLPIIIIYKTVDASKEETTPLVDHDNFFGCLLPNTRNNQILTFQK